MKKKANFLKVLCLGLAAMMMLSVLPITISATPTSVAIDEEADWNAYKQDDGSYKLNATETYTVTASMAELTVTFDGNGATVDTSVPLFTSVNGGTVKNLTVTGDVNGASAVCSSVGTLGATFEKVTNKANITGTSANPGGIVGAVGGSLTMTECKNSGAITGGSFIGGLVGIFNVSDSSALSLSYCSNTGDVTGGNIPGGIVGLIQGNGASVNIDHCQNEGNITSASTNNGHGAGGIVGSIKTPSSTIVHCTNTGTIVGNKTPDDTTDNQNTNFGGIIGYTNISVTVRYCLNKGNIGSGTSVNEQRCGGIIGQAVSAPTVEYCGNEGEVKGLCYVAGIIGNVNGKTPTINYCYNTANITVASTDFYAAGITTNPNGGTVSGCYNSGLISGTGSEKMAEIWAKGSVTTDSNNYDSNDFTELTLKSGEFAKTMNDAIGKIVYYQNINEGGAAKDTHPVTDPTHGYVFDYNGTLYSLAFYTLQSASVRLDGVERAMRFSTAVNKADYTVLTNAGITFSFGTLITPDAYLGVAGYDFTKEGLEKLDTTTPYLNVVPSDNGSGLFREVRGANNTDYYYFCGTISEIKQDNYEWDYSAIGYITVGSTTLYSGQYATRNIAYVANAALNDTAAGYTDTELEIIGGYLPQN